MGDIRAGCPRRLGAARTVGRVARTVAVAGVLGSPRTIGRATRTIAVACVPGVARTTGCVARTVAVACMLPVAALCGGPPRVRCGAGAAQGSPLVSIGGAMSCVSVRARGGPGWLRRLPSVAVGGWAVELDRGIADGRCAGCAAVQRCSATTGFSTGTGAGAGAGGCWNTGLGGSTETAGLGASSSNDRMKYA